MTIFYCIEFRLTGTLTQTNDMILGMYYAIDNKRVNDSFIEDTDEIYDVYSNFDFIFTNDGTFVH